MKPRAFEYVRPSSLADALVLLADTAADNQVLAGGQSLVPMMNLRVASPGRIVDIGRLPELRVSSEDRDSVTLGACVTHAEIEDGRVPDPSRGLMRSVAAALAYRAVRNRGTIGGSLALADPAAEWPTVLAALGAQVVLQGAQGRRTVDADGFVSGIYETTIDPGELVVAVVIPKLSSGARTGYVKFARKTGAFADSIVAVVLDPARGRCRAVLGAAAGAPLLLSRTSALPHATLHNGAALAEAVSADLQASDRGFDEVQTELHSNIIKRTVAQVLQ